METVPERRRTAAVVVFALLLAAEAALVAVLVTVLAIDLLKGDVEAPVTAIALLALGVIAVVWLVAIALGIFAGGRSWVRGASTVWQVLQAAVGVGALPAEIGEQGVGWALLVPSLAGLLLVFWPSVVRWTRRRDD